jgi:DNA-binding HxlR family transcriptional regulator
MESAQLVDVFDVKCPSRTVMEHLASKWGVLVQVVLLRSGTLRFSELRRAIGSVSEKMLSQTLQTLERDGLINRLVHPVIPPHVDYSLTDLGIRAATAVNTLVEMIEHSMPEFEQAQIAYDERKARA